jgi:hypothetical protein
MAPDPSTLDPLLDDTRRRIVARVANDVRQSGAKAIRKAGRAGLAEWIEEMIPEWRQAANEMMAPLVLVAASLNLTAPTVGDCIDDAMRQAVVELTRGGDGGN